MQDLVLLVADKNMQFALRGALTRPEAVGIRSLSFEFRTHMGRDGGVRSTGADILNGERNRFKHALMVLDHEGSGREGMAVPALEAELDQRLQVAWGDRAKAIVIAPEVDIWLWGADNALREVFQWPENGLIRNWLRAKGFEFHADGKPLRPKEALDAMVRVHKQPRSSALYEKITSKISLQNCQDAAFNRLRNQLRLWFPPVPPI